jgi:hypothetical protein
MAVIANPYNPKIPSSTRSKPDISSIYTIQLEVRREGASYLTLDTPIPENFGFSLASSYDRPFAKPLSEMAGDKIGMGGEAKMAEDVARASTGITSIMKYLSGAVWSSGSAMTISIPFVIVAHDNAYMEVTHIIKKLTQLAAPSESTVGTLIAPGPHVGNTASLLAGDFTSTMQLGGDEITLRIGRFMKFTPCIINSVHTTFDSQFDQSGNPIAATINVEFEAFWTTTKEDLDKFFTII